MDYKKILDALPELIYITKPNGISGVFFNKAWYDYTGFTEEEAVRSWASIVDRQDALRVSKIIQDAVSQERPYEVEVRLLCKDTNEFRWFLAKANPVFDGTGRLENYVGISTDIHEIKLSVQDINAVYENEMAKRLEKIKELESELNKQ